MARMRYAWLAVCLFATSAAAQPPATERYAPAQLEMAQQSLLRAREASLLGEQALAGKLAWQASVDARLAWGMSDSPSVHSAAARVLSEARNLVHQSALAATTERR
jgi:hypothetical protein